MKTQVNMRPAKFSRSLQDLADAFVPLVNRMLTDPEVVFTRPDALAHVSHFSSKCEREQSLSITDMNFIMGNSRKTLKINEKKIRKS